jgi:hypothetical protein
MRFDEDNGSFVGQGGVHDVGDKIPPQAIRRMGVGFFRPIEGHLLAEAEGQCSTQVEPSPAEHTHDLNQRQAAHPQPEDHSIEQSCPESPAPEVWSLRPIPESLGLDTGVSGGDQGQDEDPSKFRGYGPLDDQGNPAGQDEDRNSDHEDDQVVSQETPLEARTRREKKIENSLQRKSISLENVVGSVCKGVSTRWQLSNFSSHHAFISCVEPKKVYEALEDPDWLIGMHDELNNFERNKVWTLVERPKDCRKVIGTKWIFKNKQDANGIVIRNKARLVAQSFSQVKGIDFGETFAPVACLESIHILLAYASHHNFKIQQMNVKSAFLNGPLTELVFVKQPSLFENPKFPNHIYKLDEALYGLKQAPCAWYEHLKELLVDRGFEIGVIDPTLFTKKVNRELFICKLYVDDIIFGSTNKAFND